VTIAGVEVNQVDHKQFGLGTGRVSEELAKTQGGGFVVAVVVALVDPTSTEDVLDLTDRSDMHSGRVEQLEHRG
jgi:hypothetical protein